MKRFLLFAMIILSQCAWEFPNGWDIGFIKPTGIKYPGVVATTNQTLTAAQTGNTIVFNNSTGVAANGTQFTLPTAVVGMQYTVIADVAKSINLKPQSTDTINFSTAIAGQRLTNATSSAIGDSISVICMTANTWSIVDKTGTWTLLPN